MNRSAIFTKKVSKGGRGYSIRIPKDVVRLLRIGANTVLEVNVKVLSEIVKSKEVRRGLVAEVSASGS